jgi:hypothetical protein
VKNGCWYRYLCGCEIAFSHPCSWLSPGMTLTSGHELKSCFRTHRIRLFVHRRICAVIRGHHRLLDVYGDNQLLKLNVPERSDISSRILLRMWSFMLMCTPDSSPLLLDVPLDVPPNDLLRVFRFLSYHRIDQTNKINDCNRLLPS